jgi:hypothetical protein
VQLAQQYRHILFVAARPPSCLPTPAHLIASSRFGLSQASIRREHVRLSASMDALAAQRVYIKRVKQLSEYGGSFFFATVRAG